MLVGVGVALGTSVGVEFAVGGGDVTLGTNVEVMLTLVDLAGSVLYSEIATLPHPMIIKIKVSSVVSVFLFTVHLRGLIN